MNGVDDLEVRNRLVAQIVEQLAYGEYKALQLLSGGRRLSAVQIEASVREYGRKIVALPASAVHEIDYVEVCGSTPRAWSVRCPIYTMEEGRSDLTLELTLHLSAPGEYGVELDGLHVL